MVKNILFSIIPALILFLIIELLAALFFMNRPTPSYSFLFQPFIDYEKINLKYHLEDWDSKNKRYKPGKYYNKNNNVRYEINKLGFRGPEFDIQNKPNCLILAYGGSTTVGLETSYNYSYPKVLEDKLKSKNRCSVLNFGASSVSLKYIATRLFSEIDIFKPKYVLIYNNRNSAMYDATTSKLMSNVAKNRFNLLLFKIQFYFQNNVMTYKFIQKLLLIYNESKNYTPHPTAPDRRINLQYFDNGYFDIIDDIHDFLNKRDIKLVLIKQVHQIDTTIQKKLIKNKIEDNIILLEKYNKINLDRNVKDENLNQKKKIENYFMLTNAILNSQLDKIKKKHKDIILVDPVHIFFKYNKNKWSTGDGLHLNAFGNELLANEISKNF